MLNVLKSTMLAAGLSLALLGAAGAQTITWKFGWASADSDSDPNGVTAHEFKKAVEARTGGKIKIELYPNRQLGDEKAMVEGLRFGTLESATITTATLSQTVPDFQICDLPFLFPDAATAHRVLDGPIGDKLADELAKKGIQMVGFMELGFRHMVNNKRPVTKPEDLIGVKYRVMQSPLYIAMFSSLGGNAVPMAWGEMFAAMQQGAVDGMESPLSIIEANKIYELGKYLSLTGHTYSAGGILVSKSVFDRLSPELQKEVVQAGHDASKAQREAMENQNATLLAQLKKQGMIVNVVSDKKAFRDKLTSVYNETRKKVGDQLMDELLAAVEKK